MAFSVQMPALGESVTEGTVTRWLKQVGDTVDVDEPLLEVSTDKVDTEIPSPAAGVLQKIVVSEDETVEVGAELAVIGDTSENGAAPSQPAPSEAAPSEAAPSEAAPSEAAPSQPTPAEPAQTQPTAQPAEQPAQASTPPQPAQPTGGAAEGAPVTMPALGESVTEGTVTRWLKQVGDTVEVDEPLLEVSTDKVDTEIPSPVSGTLLEIVAGEDTTVEVGGRLAVVGEAGAAPAAAPAAQPAPEPQAQPAPEPEAPAPQPAQAQAPQPAPPAAEPTPQPATQPTEQPQATRAPAAQPEGQAAAARVDGETGTPYVTPLVRKIAAENNVDLSTVQGTGVGGRIRKQDVLAAVEAAKAEQPAPAAAERPAAPAASPEVQALRGKTEKLSRLRQIVAQRTRESLQLSAQLTQVFEVDVTQIARLRDRAKKSFEAREGVKLTFLPFFAKAAVEALKQHPRLNASIDEERKEVTYYSAEHLGVAIDTERGLLNAVIHDAGELNLSGLAHKITDLAERTRANKVTPDELSGGTFSLTNLGSNGALFDTPIIVQPQVGILGVGVVRKRPVVVTDQHGDDTIAIRSMAYLALTYDHRLVDGADAGRFLTTVKNRLEEGAFESDLGL
jgi:pyruvate dehydrogenase E2 component (dihydrolipoamide acetyltransferase)